jgi:hypothetical protein
MTGLNDARAIVSAVRRYGRKITAYRIVKALGPGSNPRIVFGRKAGNITLNVSCLRENYELTFWLPANGPAEVTIRGRGNEDVYAV